MCVRCALAPKAREVKKNMLQIHAAAQELF